MKLRDLPTLPIVLVVTAACSTNHVPQRGPRLSIVMEGGALAYHRDGQTYPHGFAGSGLVDAVEDDPEAREAAETFHDRQVGGIIAMAAGLACGIAGVSIAVSRDDTDEQATFGAGALACFVGGLIAGSVLVMTAQPYQWDAINIYNDHVDQRLHMMRCSPYYCPPGFLPPPQPAPYAPTKPPVSTE